MSILLQFQIFTLFNCCVIDVKFRFQGFSYLGFQQQKCKQNFQSYLYSQKQFYFILQWVYVAQKLPVKWKTRKIYRITLQIFENNKVPLRQFNFNFK